MTTELKTILDAAMQLPDKDRAALVSRLLDSLPDEGDKEGHEFDTDEAFFEELDRRFAEGLDACVDWKTVRDEQSP